LGAVVPLVCLLAACSGGGDDSTLQPIPIQGGTAPRPTTAAAATTTTTTASGVIAVTTTTFGPTTTSGPTTTVAAAGDWDGATFDVGKVSARTKVGTQEAISFDRWSYTAPDGTLADGTHLKTEPAIGWWQTTPFSNVQVRNRTFVLAPNVQVMTLDEAGRAAACTTPPPPTPAVTWKPSDLSALGADPDAMDVLTYSTTGEVTRIRITHGC
jgi:hypothetical protein